MAELFQKSRSTINEHIINIYNEQELEGERTMRKIGNSDFTTKPTNFYNLDVIISVGYRVKSHQGTKFRQWATTRLKEYYNYKEINKSNITKVEENFINQIVITAKGIENKSK